MAVLRAWFARAELKSPETRHLEQILLMLGARSDAHPLLELAETKLRVHGTRLVLDLRKRVAPPPQEPQPWRWRRGALALPRGALAVRADPHGDLDLKRLPGELTLHRLATAPGRGRSLRKLFQELALPHWEREELPLLYASGGVTPLAIADLWLHPDVRSHAGSSQRGRFVWRSLR
jgi:tRNA(Ile)-lysidine synthase